MPYRHQPQPTPQPPNNPPWLPRDLTLVFALLGVVVWVFTTFATNSSVKDITTALQQSIRESNDTLTRVLEKQNAALVKYIDDRHSDAIGHSDTNRQSMERNIDKTNEILNDLKTSIKSLEGYLMERPRARH
jgi:peptidoglycan hydrolase CwlO-like protein